MASTLTPAVDPWEAGDPLARVAREQAVMAAIVAVGCSGAGSAGMGKDSGANFTAEDASGKFVWILA